MAFERVCDSAPLRGTSYGVLSRAAWGFCFPTVPTHAAESRHPLPFAVAQECDSLELLELQSVLLEHVLGTKIALQSPSVVSDPAAALERVEGHVDKLRRSPSLPAGLNHLTGGSDDQIRPVTPGSSPATGGGGAGMVGGTSVVASGYRRRTPLPPSVAVVSSDSTTRRIVAGAISASSSSIDIACFETLEEASWAPDTRVVVFCPSPDAPFRSSTVLPRTMPTGKLRGFVIVGDVQQDAAETVYSSDVGWCELVRGPLRGAPSQQGAASLLSCAPRHA